MEFHIDLQGERHNFDFDENGYVFRLINTDVGVMREGLEHGPVDNIEQAKDTAREMLYRMGYSDE